MTPRDGATRRALITAQKRAADEASSEPRSEPLWNYVLSTPKKGGKLLEVNRHSYSTDSEYLPEKKFTSHNET
jgi:hypothetical protein